MILKEAIDGSHRPHLPINSRLLINSQADQQLHKLIPDQLPLRVAYLPPGYLRVALITQSIGGDEG
jgi:hypothetical protein